MHIFKVFFLLFLSFSFLWAQTQPLEKVSLQLQWKHQFEYAGFYAAQEKGFYADVGLDVTFVEYNTSKKIVQEVLQGNAQYGVTYASLIANYLEGDPVVMLANFFKQSPLVLVAQKEIKSPIDLKGKRVMGISKSIQCLTLLTMLHPFNMTEDDLIDVPISFDLDNFIEKRVDAMSMYTTNELFYLNKRGIPYTILDPVSYGAKYYDLNLFTTTKELLTHPQRARDFRDASIKGWKYALAHKDEIIALIQKKYNTQHKSTEALHFEAKQTEQIMLPNIYPIGSIDPFRIQAMADNFRQSGYIKNPSKRDLNAFIYTENKPSNLVPVKTLKEDLLSHLSPEAQAYLAKEKKIVMCVDPDWMPFEKIENGKYIGIGSEYIEKISKLIGVPIVLHLTTSWSATLDAIQTKKCDILPMLHATPSRKKYLNFTRPYLQVPLVIATTYDKQFIGDAHLLKDKEIGLVKGYAHKELLQSRYPNIHFVEVKNIETGLKDVASGRLFGFIENLTVMSYQIQKYFPQSLKIAGRLSEKLKVQLAVRKDIPQLLSIMDTALSLFSKSDKEKILNHWVSVQYIKAFDYSIFWYVFIPLILLALYILIRQYILVRYNRQLKKEVSKKVSELKQKNEALIQKDRMAAMGEMLSMIAHQWKQPLSAISSVVMGIDVKIATKKFNLENKTGRAKFLHYLSLKHQDINTYIQHLSSTTDNFRNFFNPNKSKEMTSLTVPINDALEIVHSSLESQGIEVITDFNVALKLSLYPNEIIQVVINILKNSSDNFQNKRVKKPIILLSTQREKNMIILRICDNGGGVSKEVLPYIFDPYFSTKDEKNGAGLGLYMSKIIIEKHHQGKLTLHNTENGVCFEIQFTHHV